MNLIEQKLLPGSNNKHNFSTNFISLYTKCKNIIIKKLKAKNSINFHILFIGIFYKLIIGKYLYLNL